MSKAPKDQAKECQKSRFVGLVHHKLHANNLFDTVAGFVAPCHTDVKMNDPYHFVACWCIPAPVDDLGALLSLRFSYTNEPNLSHDGHDN